MGSADYTNRKYPLTLYSLYVPRFWLLGQKVGLIHQQSDALLMDFATNSVLQYTRLEVFFCYPCLCLYVPLTCSLCRRTTLQWHCLYSFYC